MDAATELYLQNLRLEKRFLETVSAGSSMKFCLVAQGRADEYPRFGPTMEWDTAAGHAILLSIGKNIYSLQDGDVIRYNKKEMINGPFVAR
jgi:3'(2'), 5'-bisphosphate nucleotidase